MISRRSALAAIAGASLEAGWPALAQSSQRLIGILMPLPENSQEGMRWISLLREELARLGWRNDVNLRIAVRWVAGATSRLAAEAAALLALKPEVVVVHSSPALFAVLSASRSVPIVGISFGDPVESGLAASLARPGGTVTGFSNFEYDIANKWLEMLIALVPGLRRVLFPFNPSGFGGPGLKQVLEAAAPGAGLSLITAQYRDLADFEAAIRDFAPGGGSLIVPPDFITGAHRNDIVALAARHHVPAVYPFRNFVEAGGLFSYGVDQAALYRPAAGYVDRILRGESAGDLPIQFPKRYELVVNLATATALGLTFPPSILLRADDVIE